MKKTANPILSLAVVMALALAAVFGAMALTGTAQAAVDQAADTKLTERVDSPATPANLDATAGYASVTLEFTDQDDTVDSAWEVQWRENADGVTFNEFGEDDGSVEVEDSEDATVTGTTDPVKIVVSGLTNDQEYCFRVRRDETPTTPAAGPVCETPRDEARGTYPSFDATAPDPPENGTLVLEWDWTPAGAPAPNSQAVTKFQYQAIHIGTSESSDLDDTVGKWKDTDQDAEETGADTGNSFEVDGLMKGNYIFKLRPVGENGIIGQETRFPAEGDDLVDDPADGTVNVFPVDESAMIREVRPERFVGASNDPGDSTRYTFEFNADDDYVPGIRDIKLELHADFSIPGTINESSVTIQVHDANSNVTHPVSVLVDGEEITLQLGDLNGDVRVVDNLEKGVGLGKIDEGTSITVIFRPSAGIKNPTEGGEYEIKAQGEAYSDKFRVDFKVSTDEDDGGRGDVITATGTGFKNGTTVTFMRMASQKDNDFRNAEVLCAAQASSDDVASCEFTVTAPLFTAGSNYINAFDGKSAFDESPKEFVLKASIQPSPDNGSPGDTIQVQMYDFKPGNIDQVLIARRPICEKAGEANVLGTVGACPKGYTDWAPSNAAIPTSGERSFRFTIPNEAPSGAHELRVVGSGKDNADSHNIVIAGPRVTTNPESVIANQRLSLTGSGFTANSRITKIAIAGTPIKNWPANTGPAIDNGGNWSLSLDLPITATTTSAGIHTIEITDQAGRTGAVSVTVPERKVTITPDSGRVGTIAVVRGENFPSKNDDGVSFSLQILYQAQNGRTTTTAVPDASGNFETQLRIPTTATIPSNNLVTVSLDSTDGTMPPVQVGHSVPEGAIDLSDTSGGPGSVVTITGEGFKSFVPVTQVTVGALDVTPSPKPSTDVNGMLSFDITIPGLDTGIQTIEVKVSGTTAGTGFTVTESGINQGEIKPTAAAIEPLGENLVSVWHFNNDTKTWAFYDPALMEGNTLTHMITGETYLIRVKSTAEVILNRDTRSLTCVGGNCWNQIVW